MSLFTNTQLLTLLGAPSGMRQKKDKREEKREGLTSVHIVITATESGRFKLNFDWSPLIKTQTCYCAWFHSALASLSSNHTVWCFWSFFCSHAGAEMQIRVTKMTMWKHCFSFARFLDRRSLCSWEFLLKQHNYWGRMRVHGDVSSVPKETLFYWKFP